MSTMTVELNKDKYLNALLFFISYCNNKWLGVTKLNKLMYYFDFISYRDHQKSATGDIYAHWEKGPVPKHIEEMLQELKRTGKITAQDIPYLDGKKTEFTALSEPDMQVFSTYENRLLEAICKQFELWPTQKIVDQTHFESPWLYSQPLDDVDYEYAYDIDIIPESNLATNGSRTR